MMADLDFGMLEQIKQAIEMDSLIIFVGAGVSNNSGLPLWKDIIDQFQDELNLQKQDDTSNLKVPQYYYDTFGQNRYFQKLEEIFKPFVNAEPNFVHDYIAKIKPKHIITTNYDDLLEKRLSFSDMQYDVITEDKDIPYSRSNHYLIKMHGDLSKKNIVLKESDYLEYEDNFYMVSGLIQSLIMNHTLLFIGYSLSDSTFNSIFRLIQKSFGDNAKRAYFYTPDAQSDIQIRYYEKKGVHILSNADADRSKADLLEDFLRNFDNNIDVAPQTGEQVWSRIKFLNQLNFIDDQTVARYTNLAPNAGLLLPNKYDWRPSDMNDNQKFLVGDNKDIIHFITNKTGLVRYLDFTPKDSEPKNYRESVLKPAFDLYLSKKYSDAKLMFRKLANLSYQRRDYWNYLVAEFNIEHINVSDFSNSEQPLPEPVLVGVSFDEVMNGLILRGSQETKKLVKYFKDEIQSFKFIYRKLFKFDKLLDDLREERLNYRDGGGSWNHHLFELREDMISMTNFIEYNGLTIYHYSEYQKIVDRYFEALLQALDNSQIVPREGEIFFGSTSSTIDQLSWQDLQPVLKQWHSKKINMYLDSLQFKKIKIETSAFEAIINQLLKSIDNGDSDEYTRLVDVISQVEIQSVSRLIEVFSRYPVHFNNARNVRKILNILWQYRAALDNEQKNIVFMTVNDQINTILANKKWQKSHQSNVTMYKLLLDSISVNDVKIELSLPGLNDELSLIKHARRDIKTIESLSEYIEKLYSFFEVDTKQLVIDILHQYETQSENEWDLFVVVHLILADVYQFESLKKWILDKSIEIVKKKQIDGVQSFPDWETTAIVSVLDLMRKEYFTRKEIDESGLITNDIKGKSPEIDWVWFKIHTTDVVTKLLENRSFKNAKNIFGTTLEEAQVFDGWAISKVEEE